MNLAQGNEEFPSVWSCSWFLELTVRVQLNSLLYFSWNFIRRRMPSSGMLCRVALVRADVSEERSASIIWVTRIGELETTLTITSTHRTLRKYTMLTFLAHRFLSPWWWRRYVPRKRLFLHEPQGVTCQKTAFFIVTAMKTSNLT
jgi:hypothetical protein